MRKNFGIEWLRILSTFGIVSFHSGVNGQEIAYSGLIVFLVLSMYLGGQHGSADMQTFRRRVERLIVPWIVWFGLYACLNAVRGQAIIPNDDGLLVGILRGPSIHLWYIPFIFICLICLDVIRGRVPPSVLAIGSGLLAISILMTTQLWRSTADGLMLPLPQWIHASAAIFVGIYILCASSLSRLIGILGSFFIICSAVYVLPSAGVGVPYLIGVIAVVVVVSRFFERYFVDVSFISECMFGVYFLHVLVIMILYKFGMGRGVLLSLAVFVISLAVVFLLRRLFPSLARYWS